MSGQYSDSPLIVAVDSASPITSVAVGWIASASDSRPKELVLGSRTTPSGRSSIGPLALLDELLAEHRLRARDIDRLIANRGPGSFTGLRIGMATLMGLCESLEARATAVTAFRALLAQQQPAPTEGMGTIALVDALRGEWFAQVFDPDGDPLTEPEIVAPARILEWAPCRLAGFGLERLPRAVRDHQDVEIREASPLAPTLLAMGQSEDLEWDDSLLTRPLYLRAPAAVAKRR